MLEHALAYAAAGWSVPRLQLPEAEDGNGRRIGKAPFTKHGKDDATTDEKIIRSWWGPRSRYNIGIRPPAGVIVLDIDPRNGGAVESLGDLPETVTARTGSGGWHYWYRMDLPLGRRFAKVVDGAPGVDIKAHTGYLVAPPSIHPDTGRHYVWTRGGVLAALPQHLRSRVLAPVPVPRAWLPRRSSGGAAGLVRTVADAGEGNRNQALFWAACRVFTEHCGDPTVLAELTAAAAAAGLSAAETEQTIRSAERKCA